MILKGKKVLLGVTGSIAAYKAVYLVRYLVKEGAEVKVIMTPAAKDFITPLTLATLSKNEVLVDIFKGDSWSNHVMLGRWADVLLIAPLSCNTLAKMAMGLCDNLLLAVYLSATCTVILAPAMDGDMWIHPATQRNLETVKNFGNIVLPVENGELASGLTGQGRMTEPDVIVAELKKYFAVKQQLLGKKVLVTAGPTYEQIDPVRFIGNHSSGKMGTAIAHEFLQRGAEVNLVIGPTQLPFNFDGLAVTKVNTAEEMYIACIQRFDDADFIVMAAAVADYTPVSAAEEKIKKKDNTLQIELKKTRDILKSLGERKKSKQVLAGFALETNNERAYALQKLEQKNADIIILNSLRDKDAGFGKDTNKVTIFDKNGLEKNFSVKTKEEVSHDIVDFIIQYSSHA